MRLPFRYGIFLPRRTFPSLVALGLLASAAQAQTKLDPPAIRQVDSSRSSLTMEVQAGPSGAPAGFRVSWMKAADFDANGGWPLDLNSPLLSRAQFYGVPTWNVSSGSYQLAPDAKVQIELGDLFDETGVLTNNVGELGDQQPYVIRVQAVASGTDAASDMSPDLRATTKASLTNCTRGPGFWKQNPSAWPVSSLVLGTVSYTAAQLLSILSQPAHGNGLVILAHQLIAAKLNLANGADPTPIAAAIAAADAQIGDLVVPPVGAGSLDPDDTDPTSKQLDDFNNGNLGVPRCGSVPTQASTWGNVKARYR